LKETALFSITLVNSQDALLFHSHRT